MCVCVCMCFQSQIPDLNLSFLNNTLANIIPANTFEQLDSVAALTTSIDIGAFQTLVRRQFYS